LTPDGSFFTFGDADKPLTVAEVRQENLRFERLNLNSSSNEGEILKEQGLFKYLNCG
jgi:hypothetical protein